MRNIFLAIAVVAVILLVMTGGFFWKKTNDNETQIEELRVELKKVNQHLAETRADILNLQNGNNIHAEELGGIKSEIEAISDALKELPSGAAESDSAEEAPQIKSYTEEDIDAIARVHYYEDRYLPGEEQDLLTWCVLQRADDGIGCTAGADTAIIDTITYPRSWDSYSPNNPIVPEVRERVVKCIEAWARGEQAPTHPDYAPTLPYYGYFGDGHHNYFHGR